MSNTKQRDEAIQKEYESITSFKGDWSRPLREKYNLTFEELLNIIKL